MAYSEKIPIYAIVEERIEINGILSQITIYAAFILENPASLISAISLATE